MLRRFVPLNIVKVCSIIAHDCFYCFRWKFGEGQDKIDNPKLWVETNEEDQWWKKASLVELNYMIQSVGNKNDEGSGDRVKRHPRLEFMSPDILSC
jgi:hypothetical protein